MEASALRHAGVDGLRGPTPLLRLQSDERLVVLVRRGNQSAYEALVGRYQSRLLAFCRHMLGSREDAEDVLQEVFAAAFNAMVADDRPLNVRPWLYRIARNRSLNHLRRVQAVGVDSMDHHLSEHGTTTADKVHRREEFRQLMEDVRDLPETQRTALLLREIEALSYEQIAEAMETTVPSVKSLLVRARVSLAEAAEARKLTCDEVRIELGEVAEGLRDLSPSARRHVRGCDRCAAFRKELRRTQRALAFVLPVGPFLLIKKLVLANAGAGAGGAAAAASGAGTGSLVSAGGSAIASKAAATVAAAAIVTAGAVEVEHVRERAERQAAPVAAVAPELSGPDPAAAPQVVAALPQPSVPVPARKASPRAAAAQGADEETGAAPQDDAPAPAQDAPAGTDEAAAEPGDEAASAGEAPSPGPPERGSSSATLPPPGPSGEASGNGGAPAPPEEEQAPAQSEPPPESEPPPPESQSDPPPSSSGSESESTASEPEPAGPSAPVGDLAGVQDGPPPGADSAGGPTG